MPKVANPGNQAMAPRDGHHEPTIGERERARAAVGASQWEQAFDALSALDATDALAADDLEALGEAAWWLGRLPESTAARERAVAAHIADGHPRQAALVALRLFYMFSVRGEDAIATGWLRRASRLLQDQSEGVEHGQLLLAQARVARARGDADGEPCAAPGSGAADTSRAR